MFFCDLFTYILYMEHAVGQENIFMLESNYLQKQIKNSKKLEGKRKKLVGRKICNIMTGQGQQL